VEFKALARLTDNEMSQLLNELKASRKRRGLLINFGVQKLEFRRVVWGWGEGGSSSAPSA
jgi:GxxExxY protein